MSQGENRFVALDDLHLIPESVAERRRPIGVFDSGVGGLSVLKVLREVFPREDFIYIGDNANNPVGNKTPEEIVSIACRIADTLAAVPVKMMVVACNTFTVMALDEIRERVEVPVIGVCQGVKSAILMSKAHTIGIMATAATGSSHIHKHVALEIEPQLKVWEQPCPELAGLIERGYIEGAVLEKTVRDYLAPIQERHIDTVVLGCTHFPFVKKELEKITGETIRYVDPAYETAELVGRVLRDRELSNDREGMGTVKLRFTKETGLAKKLAGEFMDECALDIDLCQLM